MPKTFIFVLILFFIIPFPNKLLALDFGKCHYYLDLEKSKGCWFAPDEESNYLVRYGYKYCGLFEIKKTIWKDERQRWISNTRECLQEFLKKTHKNSTCVQLENSAFDSHPKCYKEAGFCNLNSTQQATIFITALSLDIILKPRKSAKQFFIILKECIKFSIEQVTSLKTASESISMQNIELKMKAKQLLDLEGIPADKLDAYLSFANAKLFFGKTGILI